MSPKNLAELKRYLKVGTALTLALVPHDRLKVGTTRQIIKVQGNGIQFSDKYWLWWPPADCITFTEDGFTVNGSLGYTYNPQD